MDYLRQFTTHEDYEEYMESQEKVLPNVCRCKSENDLHYNRAGS